MAKVRAGVRWWRGSLVRASAVAFARIAAVALAAATPARAQTLPLRTEAIRLRYDVEPAFAKQCPGQLRFVELLRTEDPQLTLAPEGATARTFDVRIRRRREGGFSGEVVVTGIDGSSNTRDVTANDCAALARALAVVAAIASDVVRASEAVRKLDPAESAPEKPEVPAQPLTEPAPSPTAPRSKHHSTSPGGVDHGSKPAPDRAQPESPPWRVGVGVGSELVLGSLPQTVVGYRGYVDAQRGVEALTFGGRLSVAFASTRLPGTTRVDVHVQTWTARLEGCANHRLRLALSLQGCAGVTSGLYDSFDTAVAHSQKLYPWLAFGAGGRLRWHVGYGVMAELFGHASYAATVYDAVAVDDSGAFSRVSRVVGEFGLGLGYSFGGK